jgi:shikimate dehydrogenase
MSAPPLSGNTRLFPVIGHPVAQVRAPAVFNPLFAQAGEDAACFGLDLPSHAVVEGARALLQSRSVAGLLVTVPFKKTLAVLADRLGPAAARAGAVNALRRASDGAIEGDLFDGLGFLKGLQAAGHEIEGRRVLLLGAGGAGSAIAATLASAGVAVIGVYDPSTAAAEALASRLAAPEQEAHEAKLRVLSQPQPSGFDMVVNATPLGLKPHDPLPLSPEAIAPGTLVCDIIMEPQTTAFIAAAQAQGLPVHRGRAMLDHQVPAYLAFFGMGALAARVRIGSSPLSSSITLQETA